MDFGHLALRQRLPGQRAAQGDDRGGDHRRRRQHIADAHRLRAKPGRVEVKRLGQAHVPVVEEQKDPGKGEQDQDAGKEDHPAFEEVRKALDPFETEVVHDVSGDGDPDRVHQHGDRRG